MKRYPIIWALGAMMVLLAGCNGEGGLVGIPFKNGVECLGEVAQPVSAPVVYVSTGVNTGEPTGTADAPFPTVAQALCNVSPGQTVRIAAGTYRESVVMGLFGGDSPIVIQGVPDAQGNLPVLDGESRRTMGLALVESSNITVENIEFRNYTDEGVYVLTGSDITLRGNRFIENGRASTDPDIDGEGFGVRVEGTQNALIEANEAAANGPAAGRVAQGTLGMGIDTYGLKDSTIRGNYTHHNIGGGILVEDSEGVLVEANKIEANQLDAGDYWDGGIWVDGGHSIILKNNIITGNEGPGLQISNEDNQSPYGYVVAGNTITGNYFGLYLWNFGTMDLPPENIVRFADNTIENNTRRDFWIVDWECPPSDPCE